MLFYNYQTIQLNRKRIMTDESQVPSDGARFFVGVKQNPDGSMDYSRAGSIDDPDGKLAAEVDKADERKRQEWQQQLAVPEDVRPGTYRAVWHELRNAIKVNEKISQENKPGRDNRSKVTEQLRLEQDILSSGTISRRLTARIQSEAAQNGQVLNAEQIKERMADVSCLEMADQVGDLLDTYYASSEDGKTTGYLERGTTSGNLPLEDLIAASEALQTRLYTESARSDK
jgi:hypothetical protein